MEENTSQPFFNIVQKGSTAFLKAYHWVFYLKIAYFVGS